MKASLLLTAMILPFPLLGQWQSIGNINSYSSPSPHEIVIRAGSATVSISFLAPDVCRVLLQHPGSKGPDTSWALTRMTWPQVNATIVDTPGELRLSSAALTVVVEKQPLRISFRDPAGNVLNRDHPGKGMAWSGAEVRVWKSKPADEVYFGFGENAGELERSETHMAMWNSDMPAYSTATNPLYVSVPFFYGLRKGTAYGIFFNNTYRTSFDMGKEANDQYSFGAPGGVLEYYFFAGPTPQNVLSRFTELVGRMPMPPRWSLGYQQCRWSYTPESRLREIARTFREKKIPCDVLYLDIDYMDGYRIFTWNLRNFPDPPALIRDLGKDGFKLAVIVDPGIKVDSTYAAYRSGLAGNHFVRTAGGSVFYGDVWPGRCVFPDFASTATRRWWGDQFSSLASAGVRGWWNDMNEPSVFDVPTKTIDVNALHNADGRPTTHAAFHNVYGMMMTLGTYEGVIRAVPGERPFVLTRASFAGGQRYSAVWTGDNVASWEHLRMALTMCLNLSVSGFPFVGSDIGGFIGYPGGELFARWLQLGVFTPLMRAHSAINERNKEPWEFGEEFTEINRKTISLRYRFLPYVYTIMREASVTGMPAMRPLTFVYPDREDYLGDVSEFLFGNNLLVAPVLTQGQTQRDVKLPAGGWYDFYSGRRYSGNSRVRVDAPLGHLPLFARAGAILPLQQPVQYTSPIDTLTLVVFPPEGDQETVTTLYEDDGTSFSYVEGEYSERTMRQHRAGEDLRIVLSACKGSYVPVPRVMLMQVFGMDSTVAAVRVAGKSLQRFHAYGLENAPEGWAYDHTSGSVKAKMTDLREEREIILSH